MVADQIQERGKVILKSNPNPYIIKPGDKIIFDNQAKTIWMGNGEYGQNRIFQTQRRGTIQEDDKMLFPIETLEQFSSFVEILCVLYGLQFENEKVGFSGSFGDPNRKFTYTF